MFSFSRSSPSLTGMFGREPLRSLLLSREILARYLKRVKTYGRPEESAREPKHRRRDGGPLNATTVRRRDRGGAGGGRGGRTAGCRGGTAARVAAVPARAGRATPTRSPSSSAAPA